MKVIINQMVAFNGNDRFPYAWSTTYESNAIPRVGDFIEDPIWKDPGEYKVTGVTINYYADECYVGVEDYEPIIPSERKEEFGKMAALHGWKANWM